MLWSKVNRAGFGIVSTVRHPATRVIHGEEVILDTHDSLRHHALILAYTGKRILDKGEIWPKMVIKQQTITSIFRDLEQQTPVFKEKSLEEILGTKPSSVPSSEQIYLKFAEPHLLETIKAYLSKILVNGRMPPLKRLAEYLQLEQQVIKLYKYFFFGEPLSHLQQILQLQYITIKKEKYEKVDSPSFKCYWTKEDTRGINRYSNWQYRPSELYSPDRPYFLPHDTLPKLRGQQLINDLMLLIFPFNLKFNLYSKYEYIPGSKLHFESINHQYLNRVINYLLSEEYKRFIDLPKDFEIQMAMLDCHIWMLIDRYKKVGGLKYKYLAAKLEASVKGHGTTEVGHLAIKKADRFSKVIKTNTDTHIKAFTYHFNMAGFSRHNKYKGVDALVWSNVFLQKVERYSDVVYSFSEYLIKSYEKIQNTPLEVLDSCMFEFDVHILEPGFKERIIAENPPLPQQKFKEEFESDHEIKSYYYNYLVSQDKDAIHLNDVYPSKFSETPKTTKSVERGWSREQAITQLKEGVFRRLLRENVASRTT